MKLNPLMIIAGVFAASFAGRAIGIANATLNKPDAPIATAAPETGKPVELLAETEKTEKPAETAPATDKKAAPAEDPEQKASLPASVGKEDYKELLDAIRERSLALDNKSKQVEDRIRVLEVIETRIEGKLAELKKSNEDLSKLVSYANDASQQDISLLAKMYEQMKPARAGEIFDKMNPEIAAGFLTEMNSENAALVLTNMSTEKAYAASMIIASRNAAVHQQ